MGLLDFPMHMFCTAEWGKRLSLRHTTLSIWGDVISPLYSTPAKKVTLLGDLRHAMTCHGLVILALACQVKLQNGYNIRGSVAARNIHMLLVGISRQLMVVEPAEKWRNEDVHRGPIPLKRLNATVGCT